MTANKNNVRDLQSTDGLKPNDRPGDVISVPLDQIEPYLCISVATVRRYEAMFPAGEKVPPILIERSGPGFRYPFQIYNGAHRAQAATLAGRTVIDAYIVEAPKLPQPNIPDAYMGLFDRGA